jgi:hypothetical protein
MIKLLVDEAYAFDYLAILKVKKSPLYTIILINLSNELTGDTVDNILKSKEFSDMVDANQKVFDCVELARYGTITAKELDNANMGRHHAKVALQKAYFKNELTETKT